jgi:hypothetical protein
MRFVTYAILALALLAAPALAQDEPADSAIKNALYDIERAEGDLAGLTPSRGANIKRMQRMLGLTRERLEGSTNKDHATYLDADARLMRLEQALTDLAEGRMPGEGAAPPAAEAADEEAPAGPINPAIAAAEKEIARIAGELDGVTPADGALIQRYRIQLDQVAERLNQLSAKDNPAWRDAAVNYNVQNERLNVLATEAANSGGGGAPAPAPAPAAEGGNEADNDAIARAERELGMIERQMSDVGKADRFLSDLSRIAGELDGVEDTTTPQWTAFAAHFGAVRTAIVDGVAAKLLDDLNRTIDVINGLQPLQYLIAEDVEAVRKRLSAVNNRAGALQSGDLPSVQNVLLNFARIAKAFEERVQEAEAEHAQLGDVNGELAAIDQRVNRLRVPQALTAEAGEAEIGAFAEAVAAVRQHIETDLAYLRSVEGKTPLTVEQGNDFRSNMGLLEYGKPQALDKAIADSTFAVDAHVEMFERSIAWVGETDPLDDSHMSNRLLGEGSYDETLSQLNDGIAAVALGAAFDAAIGRAEGPDRAAQTQAFEAAMASWQEKFTQSLSAARMPEARSTDSELLAVAAEILAQEGHDYARMVINYDLHHKEKDTGDIDVGTVTTTVTVYHYEWDEFQVTTAEEEGGKYYLYSNGFRYYYQGDNTTITDRWYLSQRFRSHEILAENIDR